MSAKFVDRPRPVTRSTYDRALGRMVVKLKDQRGIRTIYQVGSVSAPGISDLDLIVIFEDETACLLDPRTDLSEMDRYLVIHALFGTSDALFRRAQQYSFFHNYRLLWGEDLQAGAARLDPAQQERLKAQIALEYLYRMYVNLMLQRTYGVYRVRDLFLHVKAVSYDLEFLGVRSGRLHSLTHQLIEWRARWFDQSQPDRELAAAVEAFFEALVSFLGAAVAQHGLYLPDSGTHRLAQSIWLQTGRTIGCRRRGILLPTALRIVGRRYFKLQNRLNRFIFGVPEAGGPVPGVLSDRFQLLAEMKHYNAQRLPYFATLGSSLGV